MTVQSGMCILQGREILSIAQHMVRVTIFPFKVKFTKAWNHHASPLDATNFKLSTCYLHKSGFCIKVRNGKKYFVWGHLTEFTDKERLKKEKTIKLALWLDLVKGVVKEVSLWLEDSSWKSIAKQKCTHKTFKFKFRIFLFSTPVCTIIVCKALFCFFVRDKLITNLDWNYYWGSTCQEVMIGLLSI